jgi:septin 7
LPTFPISGTERVSERGSTSTLWLLVCYRNSRATELTNIISGESGLGKSTLVNTLFSTSLYPPRERKGPSADIIPKTVSIQSISADIEENGVRLRLTVVDTPGFGDFVNNDESWRPIVDNIEQRFDAYLDAENKVNRMNIVDNRVHACVYFIQPTGHALKPLDIEVMRRLHTKVNLIPVIAKADTMTDEEIFAFKARVSISAELLSLIWN